MHCFSSFSGLNGVILDYNFYDNKRGTHTFTFKSDSYLEVLNFLSSNLKRDLPYLISLSCPTFVNPFPENLTRGLFFCFSESKYKYINTDLKIFTKVLHDTLHVHNKFIHNATHVTVVFNYITHKDLLVYYNDNGEYFYRESDYSLEESDININHSDIGLGPSTPNSHYTNDRNHGTVGINDKDDRFDIELRKRRVVEGYIKEMAGYSSK